MSERLGSTLVALADPTRRGILEVLARGPRSAGELASQLDVTPAVLTRHLRVLRDERLVTARLDEHDHRRHIYELLAGPLVEVCDWAGDVAGYWQGQLAAFTSHAKSGGDHGAR